MNDIEKQVEKLSDELIAFINESLPDVRNREIAVAMINQGTQWAAKLAKGEVSE